MSSKHYSQYNEKFCSKTTELNSSLAVQVSDTSLLTHKNPQEHNGTEFILSIGPLLSSSLQRQLS